MIGNTLNNSRGNTTIKLVLGITSGVLLSGVVYGLFSLSSHSSVGDKVVNVKIASPKQHFYPIKPEPQAEPKPQRLDPPVAAVPPPPPKTMATAKTVGPVVEEQEPEETWQETDERFAEEEYNMEQFEKRATEIEHLKEALPDNPLIPFERTQKEAEALLAVGQELSAISQSIEDHTATLEDRQRYLSIADKQFDDEIQLINYCDEMMADPNHATVPEVCSEISNNGMPRIQEIEEARQALRKKIMQ
jgi:hypothetical protein